MAVYLDKPTKYSSWYDLWNKVPVKLLVYISELNDVTRYNAKGQLKPLKSDLAIKLEMGPAKAKSEPIKISGGQVNQFFFIDATEASSNAETQIFFRVKSGKQEIGEVSLGKLSSLEYDVVTSKQLDLTFPVKDRSRNTPGDLLKKSLGRLSLRLLLTCGSGSVNNGSIWDASNTIPHNTGFGECVFADTKEMKHRLKTGDLLLFQESGLLAEAMNLATNTPYSRVGMVFRLPDKYTEKEKVYLLEVTQNAQRAINVVSELPTNGICLFKLWERLHSLQGGNIWLLPLSEPLREDPLQNMIEFAERALASSMMSAHQRQSSSSTPLVQLQGPNSSGNVSNPNLTLSSQPPPSELVTTPSPDLLALVQEIGIKDPGTYKEWSSSTVCAQLLKIGGKRLTPPPTVVSSALPKDPSGGSTFVPAPFYTPSSLVAHTDVFDAPILLRSTTAQS